MPKFLNLFSNNNLFAVIGLYFFQFTEIIFVDHQTGEKAYFKRRVNQPITAADNYGKTADTYGFWDAYGVGVDSSFSYQLLICDHVSFYSGFFVAGYYDDCNKGCAAWCGDGVSPYFRTAASDGTFSGVAFNVNGHRHHSNKLISVGLR